MVAVNRYGWVLHLWKKMKDGSLVQIDCFGKKITQKGEILKIKKDKKGNLFASKPFEEITEDDTSVELSIKSWLRNEAINHVGLEIRSVKSKAYEYSKEELMEMIEEEESKIIKKQGWKWIRRLAMVSLGIGFLPGV